MLASHSCSEPPTSQEQFELSDHWVLSTQRYDHFPDPTERIRHLHPSYPKIQATIGWRIQLRQILRKLVRAAPGLGSVTNDLPDGLKWRENEGNMCKKWSKWHIFPTEWMVWNTHVLSNSIGQAGPPAVDPLWQQNRQRHGDSPFQVWIPPMIPGGDRLKRMQRTGGWAIPPTKCESQCGSFSKHLY